MNQELTFEEEERRMDLMEQIAVATRRRAIALVCRQLREYARVKPPLAVVQRPRDERGRFIGTGVVR